MVHDVVKELEAAKSKVAELQKALDKERIKKLANLHTEFGYDSVAAFIKALKDASGVKPKTAKVSRGSEKKAKRAKITPEIKQGVKDMVNEGKTGEEIASALGISTPSVQNIKKELGLVKPRAS